MGFTAVIGIPIPILQLFSGDSMNVLVAGVRDPCGMEVEEAAELNGVCTLDHMIDLVHDGNPAERGAGAANPGGSHVRASGIMFCRMELLMLEHDVLQNGTCLAMNSIRADYPA